MADGDWPEYHFHLHYERISFLANSLDRHSRESGNPDEKGYTTNGVKMPFSDFGTTPPLSRHPSFGGAGGGNPKQQFVPVFSIYLFLKIPAFAGMTVTEIHSTVKDSNCKQTGDTNFHVCLANLPK